MVDPGDTRMAQVLAVPSRVRLLECLRASDGPRSVPDLADTVGLHVNTVRAHLELLVEVGLAVRDLEEPHGPGRPRVVYGSVDAAVAAAVDAAGAREPGAVGLPAVTEAYRELAAALSEEVASREEPERLAVEAGRRWADSVDGRDWPPGPVAPAAALDHLVDLLGRLGFAPRTEPLGDRVYLHACPFADLARRHPGVVCGVHLGLLRGLTSRLGSALRVTAVDPFVREDLCLVRLDGAGPAVPALPGAPPVPPGR